MIRKVLILRFSSLGDIIMTTAAVRALRKQFPQAEIDMIVREDFLDLVRFNPHLTKAIGFPRAGGVNGLRKLVSAIRAREYDVIYDAHRSLRTRLMMPFLNGKRCFYFQKHYLKRAWSLTFKRPRLNENRFLERFVEPLEPLGVKYDGGGPEMNVPSSAETSALRKVGALPAGHPVVGLIPSAQWNGKRWPLENFRAVALQLLEETQSSLVVFGGKQDTFCQELVGGLPASRVLNTQGKLSILESAALVGKCHYVIANDTGLMHVADALGVPSVLIFGPTSAGLGCLPFQPLTQVVERELWCRPCSKNGQAPCIRGKRVCLDIAPETVFQRALRLQQALLKLPT